MFSTRELRIGIIVSILLYAGTMALYWPTRKFLLVSWDDMFYISRSQLFEEGVTKKTLMRCFSEPWMNNWHPLTMLSYSLDMALSGVKSYGLPPGGVQQGKYQTFDDAEKISITYQDFDLPSMQRRLQETALDSENMRRVSTIMHIHNALVHALNTVLVFWLLMVLTKAVKQDNEEPYEHPIISMHGVVYPWIAATVATALWAWHPLRVESVAWVSERKDVLFLFWYLVGTIAWVLHEKESRFFLQRVPIVLGCQILALLAKPQAATFVLTSTLISFIFARKIRWGLLGDMMIITVVFSWITIQAQGEAVKSYALTDRILNSFCALWQYLSATVFPTGLSFFYLYERPVPLVRALPGIAIVCGFFYWLLAGSWKKEKEDTHIKEILYVIIRRIRKYPFLFLGVSWFFVALLPVIGLIHVGRASHADRYTYLAGIGFTMLLAHYLAKWGISVRFGWRLVGGIVCAFLILILLCITTRQIHVWRDSETLYKHALVLNPENYIAHENWGFLCLYTPDYEQALRHLVLAIHEDGSAWKVAFQHIFTGEPFVEVINKDASFMELPIDDKKDPLAGYKHWAKGITALQDRCNSLAVSEFEQASNLLPDNGYIAFLKAQALLADHRWEEAKIAIQSASRLLPASSRYRKFLFGFRAQIEAAL